MSSAAPSPLGPDDPIIDTEATVFLRRTLATQGEGMASHSLAGRKVWLKKAGPRNPRWRYRLLGALAALSGLEVLRPVLNLGGEAAIAHEARRLAELRALGLRVPALLAAEPGGLLLADLGDGQPVDTLLGEVSQAALRSGAEALAQWQRGLDAIALVHARGSYLSQAFARNLVACPDGVVGYIDFEDDPGATLSLAQCQARDWLGYLQSTALYFTDDALLREARARWAAVLAHATPEVRGDIARAARHMGWLRHLPQGRRWGKDTARLRAAASFLWGAGPDSRAPRG